ncbi:ABC transporter G family member 36-like [Senna tora]|uniref:ABC transporter G family member 36-like n=1 Tax=Senna tora TaxID=362788 RepID=A0A834T0H5_9FABA|nr:ABC transporter G family member 36-like [Senna tora]
MEEVFASGRYSRRSTNVDEDEEALKWAAIEKLPTYDRLRTSIFQNYADQAQDQAQGNTVMHKEVDVRKLDMNERQQIIDRIFKVAEEDNEKYLRKFRNRIEK